MLTSEIPQEDQELLRKLQEHPALRDRIESILLAVEDESGDLVLAKDAETRVIDEMRRLGQETLQAWANRQTQQRAKDLGQQPSTGRAGKKTKLAHHLWRHLC